MHVPGYQWNKGKLPGSPKSSASQFAAKVLEQHPLRKKKAWWWSTCQRREVSFQRLNLTPLLKIQEFDRKRWLRLRLGIAGYLEQLRKNPRKGEVDDLVMNKVSEVENVWKQRFKKEISEIEEKDEQLKEASLEKVQW
ncbi:hypothetical protein L195_g057751 [Trifolium pratense]|uniref:Uncharacterized protein n=1 Tax=Trifolium pratense TaxID=57577 RepID=A0A2K3KWY3_TRIPR|nr:hypothetical protein L195_g057751 [Trifolium pratense]